MDNINPIFILQPILVIIFSSALMVYWYKKRRFHKNIWLYTLIAYAGAIALKYAVQLPTINLVLGAGPAALGVYYGGVQTIVFEVGLAYALAYFAVKRGKLDQRDGEAYGSGLAFWENVGLISVLSLINLISYYFLISGGGLTAELVYGTLAESAPALFSSNAEALSFVALGTVERISSAMLHIAWGYLCFMAVIHKNKKLFLIALPMGFVDFLVPFAGDSIVLFEVGLFLLASASLFVAWYTTKQLRKKTPPTPETPTTLTIDAPKESS